MISSPCSACNAPCSIAATSCPSCGYSFEKKGMLASDFASLEQHGRKGSGGKVFAVLLIIGVAVAATGFYLWRGKAKEKALSGDERSEQTARTFKRLADDYKIGRNRDGGLVTGELILSFDEATGAVRKFHVSTFPNKSMQLPSGEVHTIDGEATYFFSVGKPQAESNSRLAPYSVSLIADGAPVFSTEQRVGKHPWISGQTLLDTADFDRAAGVPVAGGHQFIHGFRVTTAFSAFLQFANARKAEVVIDGERFTLTPQQLNALRSLGSQVAQGGGTR